MKNEHVSDGLLIQAEEQEMKSDMGDSLTTEVVTFDAAKSTSLSYAAIYDEVASSIYTEDYSLGEFLSRPTKIAHYTVTPGAPFSDSIIYPWQLYMTNSRIAKKLDNYSYIQAKLHIKIIVNSTPFIYGSLAASYRPLFNFTPFSDDTYLERTQRPTIWMDLSSSLGGEMTLPFFYYKNWLPLKESDDVRDMGKFDIYQLTTAAIANAGITSTPSFTIYAWMEDVRLYGNTIDLAVQASESGPVSSVASTISKASSYFTEIPIIGRFAKAIGIGSSAVGSIASMFGYTNHPVISDVSPYKNLPFHALSSAHISNVIDKLTLDPHNELTISPETVGLPQGDELAISYLTSIPALLSQPSWTTTAASSTLLFAANVTPTLCQTSTSTPNQTVCWDTPVGNVSRMFSNWRGDLIFHFRLVKTPYHKGRLVVNYDPTGDIVTTSDNNNVVQTLIVDISESTEFVIRVPYMAPQNFLKVRDTLVTDYAQNGGSLTAYNDDFHNGRLTVRVLNNLTAPLDTASITLQCFVYAAENYELANPTPIEVGGPVNTEIIQASETNVELSRDSIRTIELFPDVIRHTMGKSHPTPDHIYDISMGERIASVRELLRRAEFLNTERVFDATSGTSSNIYTFMHTKWPQAPGYSPTGIHGGQQINGAGTDSNYNYVQSTNFNLIAPCFVGQRGSMIWHYNLHNVDPASVMNVRRQYTNVFNGTAITTRSGLRQITTNILATSFSNTARTSVSRRKQTSAGTALVNQRTQSGLSVLYPHYNKFRFCTTNPRNSTYGSPIDDSIDEKFALEIIIPNKNGNFSGYDRYFSIGPDYNPFFFVNVPPKFIYGPATAASF
jgi:hypothetical protein